MYSFIAPITVYFLKNLYISVWASSELLDSIEGIFFLKQYVKAHYCKLNGNLIHIYGEPNMFQTLVTGIQNVLHKSYSHLIETYMNDLQKTFHSCDDPTTSVNWVHPPPHPSPQAC